MEKSKIKHLFTIPLECYWYEWAETRLNTNITSLK